MALLLNADQQSNPHYCYRTETLPDFNAAYTHFQRFRQVQRPTATDGSAIMFYVAFADGGRDFVNIVDVGGGAWRLRLRSSAGSGAEKFDPVFGTTPIALDTNYDLHIIQDGTTLSVYLDGVLELTGDKGSHHAGAATLLAFGTPGLQAYNDQTFRGGRADMALWTVAHDATQRANVIANGADAEAGSLWEYWSLHTHFDVDGVNGRALTVEGDLLTADEPQIPGVAPADLTAAWSIAFLQLPSGGSIGEPFTTQPVVEVLTLNGDRAATFAGEVTAAKVAGDGVLGGDTAILAVDGIATFVDLQIDGAPAGLSFQLQFSSPGLVSVTSPTFAQGPEFRPSRCLRAYALNAADAVATGKTFTFTSSDETVATVSTMGIFGLPLTAGTCVVKAVGPGVCTITPHCVEDGIDGDPITVTVLAAE